MLQHGPRESQFLKTGFRAPPGLCAVGPKVVSGDSIAEEKRGRDTFSIAAACCHAPCPEVCRALAWVQEWHVIGSSKLPQKGACCSCPNPSGMSYIGY